MKFGIVLKQIGRSLSRRWPYPRPCPCLDPCPWRRAPPLSSLPGVAPVLTGHPVSPLSLSVARCPLPLSSPTILSMRAALSSPAVVVRASRAHTDTNSVHVKKACLTIMKEVFRQQRYKLKKRYFDAFHTAWGAQNFSCGYYDWCAMGSSCGTLEKGGKNGKIMQLFQSHLEKMSCVLSYRTVFL